MKSWDRVVSEWYHDRTQMNTIFYHTECVRVCVCGCSYGWGQTLFSLISLSLCRLNYVVFCRSIYGLTGLNAHTEIKSDTLSIKGGQCCQTERRIVQWCNGHFLRFTTDPFTGSVPCSSCHCKDWPCFGCVDTSGLYVYERTTLLVFGLRETFE